MKKNYWIWGSIIGVGITVLILCVAGLQAYSAYKRSDKTLTKPIQTSEKKEAAAMLTHIQQYVELPEEEPRVGMIDNAKDLMNQLFFRNAENGDVLFMFPKAKKAVLYRPKTQQIINFAPMVIQDEK